MVSGSLIIFYINVFILFDYNDLILVFFFFFLSFLFFFLIPSFVTSFCLHDANNLLGVKCAFSLSARIPKQHKLMMFCRWEKQKFILPQNLYLRIQQLLILQRLPIQIRIQTQNLVVS